MLAISLVFLIPATAIALAYAVLTGIGWRAARRNASTLAPQIRFAIVIPAHDEEAVLPQTLRSIQDSDYPQNLVQVLVVADNCTDRTATVAREFGASCIERTDAVHRGKGFALAHGIPRALDQDPDAVMILDADCRLDPLALRELDREVQAGAAAVQAAVTMGDPTSGPAGVVMAVGSEIENGIQAGISRLGGSIRLRGTGMAFRRQVLERFPWQSFGLTEDAEYGAKLRQGGVTVRFVPTAGVRNSPPVGVADLCKQRERWRAALLVGGLSWYDRVITSKPLILAHLGLTLILAGLTSFEFLGWALALLAMTGWVYFRAMHRVGLRTAEVLSLWKTPGIVAKLAWVTARGFAVRGGEWVRTPRLTVDRV